MANDSTKWLEQTAEARKLFESVASDEAIAKADSLIVRPQSYMAFVGGYLHALEDIKQDASAGIFPSLSKSTKPN